MRLSKEEYKAAEDALWDYNLIEKELKEIESDIITLGPGTTYGTPKAPYHISDTTFSAMLELNMNPEYRSLRNQKIAVERATKKIRHHDALSIFNLYYKEKMSWQSTMSEIGISERTFSRRKQELIEAVHKELKKLK